MAGHSHWARIKRKKAVVDARRGQAWSKLARAVTMAAKTGGGEPNDNPRLRLAIDKAKAANMPKDTIDKAIKKGTGELEGENYEEISYEGYGPGGVAVICKATTDNRTRTAPEIKKIFERAGGNLGAVNCVSWMFTQRGVIAVAASGVSEERVLEVALEAGADDVASSAEVHEITCAPDVFEVVKKAVEDAGLEVVSAEVTMVAQNQITLDLETAQKVMKLVEALEEHDDVDEVYNNSDIPEDIVARLSQ